ncbi:MAG: hypothetical protein Q7S88_00975 [Candidatus Daviesbacteria bacterium]|nr:hypothetical protein [Candidatus Daviesbacteria bacterium]
MSLIPGQPPAKAVMSIIRRGTPRQVDKLIGYLRMNAARVAGLGEKLPVNASSLINDTTPNNPEPSEKI